MFFSCVEGFFAFRDQADWIKCYQILLDIPKSMRSLTSSFVSFLKAASESDIFISKISLTLLTGS